MKSLIYSFVFSFISFSVYAQKFTVEISSDSILYGNYVELSFNIENIEGEFKAPELDDFEILSGPNISSTMQIINGKMTSKKTYSYFIRPFTLGSYTIGPAQLITHEKVWETQLLNISVVDNPENIVIIPQQKRSIFFDTPEFPLKENNEEFLNKKPKKKLKKL